MVTSCVVRIAKQGIQELFVLICGVQTALLPTGGSISNLYAFLAARHRMFPDYKQKGLSSIPGQLVMYTSDQVGHDTRQDPSNIRQFIYLHSLGGTR
jgi:glutamate decarboxylase